MFILNKVRSIRIYSRHSPTQFLFFCFPSQGIESGLLEVIADSAASLTYETFSSEVDRLIGHDRTWTNLVLAFYVGKRVVSQAREAKNYFDQYIRSYSPVFQSAGGVVSWDSNFLNCLFVCLFVCFFTDGGWEISS